MRTLFFLGVILLYAFKSSAQIIYTDVNPDAVTSSWNVYVVHLADTSPSYLGYGTVNLWFHPFSPNEVLALTGSDCQIMVNNLTDKFPLKLQFNDSINPSRTWSDVSYKALNIGNTQGLWTGSVMDKYMGVRFKLSPGGSWLYGWIRLDVDATPDSFTVKDYAYNSETAVNSIYAGQISNSCIHKSGQDCRSYCYIDPNSKVIIIKFANPENENYTLTIYNSNGQLIKSAEHIKTGEVKIQSENWKKGIYLYKLYNNHGKINKGKFLK